MQFASRAFVTALVFTSAVVAIAPAHGAPMFGTNLISDPGADASAGSPSGGVVPVSSWTLTAGAFTAVPYGAGGGFPSATDPGSADRGANFFAGGPGVSTSSGVQIFSITSDFSTIDLGTVSFVLSGYFGGFSTQRDNAALTANFTNGVGSSLGSAVVGGVTPDSRNGATGLLFRSVAGTVPIGTREIDFTLLMNRLDGDYNDGYADSLSLILTAGDAPPPAGVPEPAPVSLVGLGLIALIIARRRSKSGNG